jgi:hypothetical protein
MRNEPAAPRADDDPQPGGAHPKNVTDVTDVTDVENAWH